MNQFLARPRPILGESLSSWRQRAGWANGFTLFPMLDERGRRVDPDVGSKSDEIAWLEQTHRLQPGALAQLSQKGFEGRIFSRIASRSHSSWWLRARLGPNARSYGPMFCAECLRTDETAHFRLAWRFAFVVTCPLHRLVLLDRCTECGVAPWPAGCGVQRRIDSHFVDLTRCWHCGADMRMQRGSPGRVASIRNEWIATGFVPGETANVPLPEFLAAVRSVCQLFLRNRSRKVIEASRSSWSDIAASLSDDARNSIAIEYLSAQDRQLLVPRAIEVIRNWPDAFLGFATDCKLSRENFSDARALQPSWMTSLIDARLAKQNRFVTEQSIATAVSALTQMDGRLPSKVKVREILGWQGNRYLDSFLERRTVATPQEWELFIGVLVNACEEASIRLHSRKAFSRDVCVMIVSLLSNSSLGEVQDRWISLMQMAKAHLNSVSSQMAFAPILHLAKCVVEEQSGRVDLLEIQGVLRQARKRVAWLMRDMPHDLLRDVRVFQGAAGLRSTSRDVGLF